MELEPGIGDGITGEIDPVLESELIDIQNTAQAIFETYTGEEAPTREVFDVWLSTHTLFLDLLGRLRDWWGDKLAKLRALMYADLLLAFALRMIRTGHG